MPKSFKFKYVKQKYEYDCGIACIAMVTGMSYDEVYSYVEGEHLQKKGLPSGLVRSFIEDHGFSCIEKRCSGFNQIKEINKEMWKPFADVHIVFALKNIDSKCTHAIVMDGKGKLYNPWDIKLNIRERYYGVPIVMGFFK